LSHPVFPDRLGIRLRTLADVFAVALGGRSRLTEQALAARLRLPPAEVGELLSHVSDDRTRRTLVSYP
jgi:hypothetical protein